VVQQSQRLLIGQCQNANEVLNVLVLSRKSGERIVIGPNIELRVMKLSKTSVQLAIDAPQEIAIYRQEVYRRIQDERGSQVRHDGRPGT
jgi:carbon storage regulator